MCPMLTRGLPRCGGGKVAICGQIGAGFSLLATFAIGRATPRRPPSADNAGPPAADRVRDGPPSGWRVLRPDPSPPPMRKLTVCVALLCTALALASCRPYGPASPYAPASPFNRAVPSNPKLLSNSAAIVDRLHGWGPVQQLEVGTGRHPERLVPPGLLRRRPRPRVHGPLPALDELLRDRGAPGAHPERRSARRRRRRAHGRDPARRLGVRLLAGPGQARRWRHVAGEPRRAHAHRRRRARTRTPRPRSSASPPG